MKYLAQLFLYVILYGISKLAGYMLAGFAVGFGLLLGVTLFVRMGGGAL